MRLSSIFKVVIFGAALAAAPAASAISPAAGERGEKTISLGAGYADYNSSAMAGVEFTYRFSRYFRLAPGVKYVFRHNGADALTINLNAHVPVALSQRVEAYPVAGIAFTNWNFQSSHDDTGDVTTRKSRFALNLGAGLGWRASSRLCLGVTAGYIFVRRFHGAEAMVRIGYAF